MSVYRRHQLILDILHEHGEVRVDDLAARLNVSENTIRNDLNALEAENALRRVRGGAAAIADASLISKRPFVARSQILPEEKSLIGQWAASLVKDGDTIMLDASSTVYYLATHLGNHKNLTVLTNGIDVALLLARNPSNKVMLASNVVGTDGISTIGDLHPSISRRFFAPKYFVSCGGLSIEQGLTSPDVDDASIKAQMMELAREVIALVDHSKFGRIESFGFASLAQINLLVTEAGANTDYLGQLHRSAHFPIVAIDGDETHIFEPLQPRQQRYFRIGFGNLSDEMPFAQQVRAGLEQAARHLPNVELLICDNALDRQTALDNAEWFVNEGIDLVIEYQLDAAAGNIIMDKFNQAHIPVIAVDIPMPGATFFGADNYRAGYIAGENLGHWINKHWQGQFDILLKLDIERVGAAVTARLQGLQEGLQAVTGPIAPEQIVTVNNIILQHEIEKSVSALLPQIPRELKVAVIGMNDDAAVGALNVFERAGRLDNVVAVGQNADRTGRTAIRRPEFPFVGSTRYAPEEYGEEMLSLALKILQHEHVPPAVYKRHIFINTDNLDEYYGES